jgi:hypothetical protein
MQFSWSAKETSARVLGLTAIAAVILTAIYILIYWLQPFAQIWNTIFSDLFLVIAASFAAIIATLIWVHYDPSDLPRRVWGHFAIGLWLWVIAEMIWGYLNVTQGEVPEGPADVFWTISYLFFAQALLVQYQILAHPTQRELISRSSIAILFLLALFLLIYSVLRSASGSTSNLDTAINSFYPAADLLLALIALWLARNFVGGAFSRPWLGLLAFSFADLLYAWIEVSGLYAWSASQGNLLSGISDVVYLAAYLVLGLGIMSHWVFLKYGLRSSTSPRQKK